MSALGTFRPFRMSAIRSLLGANRTSRQSQNGANDPTETWATKDFRSAKACSSRFAKRDIVLYIGWV